MKKWIWLLIVIVLAIVAFVVFRNMQQANDDSGMYVEEIEEVVETAPSLPGTAAQNQ